MNRYQWEVFTTFTMDPKRIWSIDERMISREVFRWCADLARLDRKAIGWAYAVEGGGGQALHAHALLIGARDRALDAAAGLWRARNGNFHRRLVDDPAKAVSYICKAIGPNGEIVLADTLRRYVRTDT